MTTVHTDKAGVPSSTGSLPVPGNQAMHSFVQRYALVLITAAVLIAWLAFIPQFRSLALITTMLNSQSILLLLALTATITLRAGAFDLSIAQVMIGAAVVTGVLSAAGWPPALAAITAIALGFVVGLINGFLVVRIGVDSFIVTLGTFTALAGLSLLVSGSKLVTAIPVELTRFARTDFVGLPLVTWYAWVLAVVLWFVYQRTPVGRYLLFVGGSPTAARLSGIRVDGIRMGTFIISSTLAAIIGVVYAGYFGSVDPSIGGQYMLQPFAAAFLGSTAIAVGRFNSLGTVVALYLLTIGITGLQLLGAQTWITNVFYGLALVLAVTAAKLAGRGGTRKPSSQRSGG